MLVRAAQTGNELAFAELVRASQDIAVAYATSILGDYHLAEDAAQEAFVEAHRELPNLREPAAFPAWFRTIVFKRCDRLTRRKRHPVIGLEAALEVASPEPSPHETPESRAIQKSVREALATLSDTEQQIVLLYYEDICSTPLGWAARFGQTATVELLLQRGAKPNLPDDPPDLAWATPLAWATRRGHGEIVELLKQHGAK